jgi:cytoskeletal protein CcmA (bactofilin family)
VIPRSQAGTLNVIGTVACTGGGRFVLSVESQASVTVTGKLLATGTIQASGSIIVNEEAEFGSLTISGRLDVKVNMSFVSGTLTVSRSVHVDGNLVGVSGSYIYVNSVGK